ncbi:Deoxyribonuclease [Hexamita inflata]|uniref:Deoxyribonuclease n=1 Tax=Hexamita inflata TaxID=28002 RepID=A0AA86NVK3_9EUKA|nr:Deoxyribonuclease [Hexamita inflata]
MTDIGANLTSAQYQGMYKGKRLHKADLDQVLARAKNAGVQKMIVTVGTVKDIKFAAPLLKYDNIWTTVGVHPSQANTYTAESAQHIRREFQTNKKIVMYGEFGLDYDRLQFSDKETQIRVFKEQLQLAMESKLPLFLHCRNAYTDFFTILNQFQQQNNYIFTGVVHSFTGSLQELQLVLKSNFYVSVNGLAFKTAEQLNTFKQIPLDKLLIETDCPYCQLKPADAGSKYIKTNLFQGAKEPEKYESGFMVKNRNEPCYLKTVIEVAAGILGKKCEEIVQITEENVKKMLNWV